MRAMIGINSFKSWGRATAMDHRFRKVEVRIKAISSCQPSISICGRSKKWEKGFKFHKKQSVRHIPVFLSSMIPWPDRKISQTIPCWMSCIVRSVISCFGTKSPFMSSVWKIIWASTTREKNSVSLSGYISALPWTESSLLLTHSQSVGRNLCDRLKKLRGALDIEIRN